MRRPMGDKEARQKLISVLSVCGYQRTNEGILPT